MDRQLRRKVTGAFPPVAGLRWPERLQRIGQDIFRARLMDYWRGRCALTGISDAALLRASHIIP
jgi:hypothetical protein